MRITESRLRQVIREVINEDVNPGSGMSMAIQKGNVGSKQDRIKLVEDELTKTYDWFKNTVFPAVEGNEWPIIVDQAYAISFLFGTMDGNADPKTSKIFIPLQKILNAEDKYIVNFPATLGKEALLYNRMSLTEMYKMLEDSVLSFKLSVPMESFPD